MNQILYEAPDLQEKETLVKIVQTIPSGWAGEGAIDAELLAPAFNYRENSVIRNTRLLIRSKNKHTEYSFLSAADFPFEGESYLPQDQSNSTTRFTELFFPTGLERKLPSSVYCVNAGRQDPENFETTKELLGKFLRAGYLGTIEARSSRRWNGHEAEETKKLHFEFESPGKIYLLWNTGLMPEEIGSIATLFQELRLKKITQPQEKGSYQEPASANI